MHSFQLNVLGMDISFRTDADSARIERAQDFVEKQYERLKNQGGQFGREKLLTLLVLELQTTCYKHSSSLTAWRLASPTCWSL